MALSLPSTLPLQQIDRGKLRGKQYFRSGVLLAILSIITASWGEKIGDRPPIGTNLNGLSYWSTELPFRDIFKTSGDWVSGTEENWNDGRKLNLDEQGWIRSLEPGQVALTVLLAHTSKFHGTLVRRYVVEYDGTGTLEYGELARLVEHKDHRDVIEIEVGEDNATMTLTSTDPRDYLRNIRVTPEGSAPGEIFNPVFLQKLKGYRALRLGIWMGGESAEDRPVARWNERSTPQEARWTFKGRAFMGAPVEIMVALANRIQADPWFTLPYNADDEFMRRFAELVTKTLDPKLKVYLEYDNEVWNDNYQGTAYAREQGLALGLSHDPQEAVMRFYAKRAVEMFSIWEKALGKNRLVRLLSFQSDGDPEFSDEIALSYGDTRKHVDALSIGPYFGTELAADAEAVARTRKMNLNELMRALEKTCLPYAKAQMLAHAAVARKYGLPMIAYEGGQHLWNMSGVEAPELDALFTAANRDPRMGALYSRYLKDWAEAGGGLFMHELDCASFQFPGNWGALEYLTQPRAKAPKYDALMRFIEGKEAR